MRNYNLTNKKITEVPFHYFLMSETKNLLAGLEERAEWLLPQALVVINQKVRLVKNELGLYDPKLSYLKTKETLSEEEFQWLGGLITYLIQDNRKSIIGSMAQTKNPHYSVLVPLVLSVFKLYRKIGYEEWDINHEFMEAFVNSSLLEVMRYQPLSKFDNSLLLSYRSNSQEVKSGTKIGTIKEPIATYRILKTGNKEFDSQPELLKIMLCQVWIANPILRMPLMVLSTPDWDSQPEALIASEIKIIHNKEYNLWGT